MTGLRDVGTDAKGPFNPDGAMPSAAGSRHEPCPCARRTPQNPGSMVPARNDFPPRAARVPSAGAAAASSTCSSAQAGGGVPLVPSAVQFAATSQAVAARWTETLTRLNRHRVIEQRIRKHRQMNSGHTQTPRDLDTTTPRHPHLFYFIDANRNRRPYAQTEAWTETTLQT